MDAPPPMIMDKVERLAPNVRDVLGDATAHRLALQMLDKDQLHACA